MRKVYLQRNETVVTVPTLQRLRRKELAHDAYLAAYEDLAETQAKYLALGGTKTLYELGWLDCYRSLADGIVAYTGRMVDDDPSLVTMEPKDGSGLAYWADRVDSADDLPF